MSSFWFVLVYMALVLSVVFLVETKLPSPFGCRPHQPSIWSPVLVLSFFELLTDKHRKIKTNDFSMDKTKSLIFPYLI